MNRSVIKVLSLFSGLLAGLWAAGCKEKPATPETKTHATAPLPPGVPRQWLEPAEAGDAEAQYHLGLLLYYGYKTPRTQEEAVEMFQRAVQERLTGQGHTPRIDYSRNDGVTMNAEEGLKWLRKAGESGHAWAQYHLGDIYANGKGIPADPKEGARWYLKAAEKGNGWSQYHLAHMLAKGTGVECNAAEAAKWFRYAAEQGIIHAQYDLGYRLSSGDGVPKNPEEARVWLHKAAEADHSWAQFNLAVLLLEGSGGPRNPEDAAKWFEQSAQQGNAESQYMLGTMYARGQGVPRDFYEAYKWVNLAVARAPQPYYKTFRKSLEDRLSPGQLQEAGRWATAFVPRKSNLIP
ncbi:MAG: SEL1-like repeat protein [Verrucomicrobiota bacterium]